MSGFELVLNPPGRLLYTDSLMQPKAFKDKSGAEGLPRYNVQVLLPGAHPLVNQLILDLLKTADEAFPARQIKAMATQQGPVPAFMALSQPGGLGMPLKNGNQLLATAQANGKEREFYRDTWVLMAQKPEKNRKGDLLVPPVLSVMQNGKPVRYEDANRPLAKQFYYNGVYAAGSFQFKDYPGFGGGITCYLDRLCSLNAGPDETGRAMVGAGKIVIGRDDEDVFGSADSYSEYMGHVSAESIVPQPGIVGAPAAPQGGAPLW